MIRKLLVLAVVLLFYHNAGAQNTRISIEANPQLIWLASDMDNIEKEGLMAGMKAGLILDFFFAERYAFSTGLVFENLGGRISYKEDLNFDISGTPYLVAEGVEVKQRLQYFGIPIGLKLKTQEIGYSTFYINPGITPMVNISSKAQGGNIPKKSDFSNESKLLNVNYFVSGGMEYSLGGSTSVFGGLGYSGGFLDVYSRSGYTIKTRSIYLTIGILF